MLSGMQDLAVAYADKDWDGVRSRYGQAVEIFAALPGYEDDAALASMYLGVAALKSGRHGSAIPIFEEVLEAFGRTASRHHWRVASIYYYLGEAHYELERYEVACGHL
jgi:tetratricopeptide (TPR) repeat protein